MKKKSKKPPPTKTISLEHRRFVVPGVVCTQFVFNKVKMLVLEVPNEGTFIFGSEGISPRPVWAYPAGTSAKKAVSQSIRQMLVEACDALKKLKKLRNA